MIFEALSILRDELQAYFQLLGDNGANVVLENIALLESANDANLLNNIVISLVNVEEESTLKNLPNRVKSNGGISYVEPPVHLNLYLLICANYVGGNPPRNSYTLSLTRLSTVIQFFQSKKVFSLLNSPNATLTQGPDSLNNPAIANLSLRLELYTLTFEQINHLWGSLGGKQLPFVMYKARLVKIQDPVRQDVPVIEEVDRDAIPNPENSITP